MYEKYISLLISLSDYMVKKVLESGNAFEGKNGPYNNKDTALRNSTHWYQIFAFLYHETKEEIYKETSSLKIARAFRRAGRCVKNNE